MINIRIAVVVISLLSPGELLACGGGGPTFRDYVMSTITVENVYNIGSEVGGLGNSIFGSAVGAVNGMLFTLANFSSDKTNVKYERAGLKAFRDLNAANQQVDRTLVGGGAVGKPSNMSIADYNDLFR